MDSLVVGAFGKLNPIAPKPNADTSNPLFPNSRVFIFSDVKCDTAKVGQ
jgi:hypothetical protein